MAVPYVQRRQVTQEKWIEHPHQEKKNVSDRLHPWKTRCIIYPGTGSHFYSDTLVALK